MAGDHGDMRNCVKGSYIRKAEDYCFTSIITFVTV